MGLFDFETAETKVRNRTQFIKSLAQKLDATQLFDLRTVSKKFSFDILEAKKCNIISGEYNGFEYCFIEYYHKKTPLYIKNPVLPKKDRKTAGIVRIPPAETSASIRTACRI